MTFNITLMVKQGFNSILDLLEAFPNEQTCIDHLERLRWNGKVVSPFDPDSKVYNCKGNRYKCKNTGKYFNVKTGTLFDNTKVPLQKWFVGIWLITSHKKGISSLQLSRDLDVTQKTAWFMLHRIRNCYGLNDDDKLTHQVEVDEVYIGGKNENRHENKKLSSIEARRSKSIVLGMVERKGRFAGKRIDKATEEHMLPAIMERVKDATIYTDEHLGYRDLRYLYKHATINHSQGEYVRDDAHTNTIEGFWSLLKRGIFGIYHFTSKKHLQKYIDEFAFRYNTRNSTEAVRFNLMLSNTGHRLKYEDLIRNE